MRPASCRSAARVPRGLRAAAAGRAGARVLLMERRGLPHTGAARPTTLRRNATAKIQRAPPLALLPSTHCASSSSKLVQSAACAWCKQGAVGTPIRPPLSLGALPGPPASGPAGAGQGRRHPGAAGCGERLQGLASLPRQLPQPADVSVHRGAACDAPVCTPGRAQHSTRSGHATAALARGRPRVPQGARVPHRGGPTARPSPRSAGAVAARCAD
jgi:hypothetical protein